MIYSFVMNLDGEEHPYSAEFPSDGEAGLWASERLRMRARTSQPAIAYVAVFRGEGDDAEPLGAYDYDATSGETIWSPEE